jgi:universal stress protein E
MGNVGRQAVGSLEMRSIKRILVRQVRSHGVSASAIATAEHPVYESILRHAQRTRADLIVTDSFSGLNIAPALLQLMDWELARLSPVPVLIVKQQRPYRRPNVLAAVDPTHAYAKPLDLDAQILGCGEKVCEIMQGTLHAVHAYTPAPFAADTSTWCAAAAVLRVDPIAGHPVDAIGQAVTATKADILVMGSMSRSGLRRLLIGNTVDKLLYRLPCDLLLVKPACILDAIGSWRRGARVITSAA